MAFTDYKSVNGERRRVHKEYVDVFMRMDREGQIEPVTVQWKDGRSFPIDEILKPGEFGAVIKGRQQARWRVRFGSHETDLYLERRMEDERTGEPELYVWWVYAYDQVKTAPKKEKTQSHMTWDYQD